MCGKGLEKENPGIFNFNHIVCHFPNDYLQLHVHVFVCMKNDYVFWYCKINIITGLKFCGSQNAICTLRILQKTKIEWKLYAVTV